ncbi:MAG: LysM peptidoglycan-binding protein [Solirubrobacterales bacterium]|nr:LysM peptidoglycan-binding protein [Solirubrobacterales bacterium]
MKRSPRILLLSATAALAVPATASAAVPHTIAPGETLWSLAAAQNMTTRAFAAANGLPEDARVIAGSTLKIPTVAEAAGALAQAPAAAPATSTSASAAPASSAAGAPPAQGGYTVRPGDTLSGLAASSRIPLAQFAQMNGLDPSRPLLTGTVVKLPTGAPAPANAAAPAPATRVVPAAAPAAAPGRVTADQIHQTAAQHGVPGSLAAAIGWQESGFNNAMVSSANARGVMQVMPGTWDWVQQNLSKSRLDPASPQDNVRAGVLYLGSLLKGSGGDPATAAAGYYQGPASVARIGMLPETRRYVDNVMALRSRFGG